MGHCAQAEEQRASGGRAHTGSARFGRAVWGGRCCARAGRAPQAIRSASAACAPSACRYLPVVRRPALGLGRGQALPQVRAELPGQGVIAGATSGRHGGVSNLQERNWKHNRCNKIFQKKMEGVWSE
jgi:hypothetical protein